MADWAQLRKVHLFAGLAQSELAQLAEICSEMVVAPGGLIIEQNTTGTEMYIVVQGSVEVFIKGYEEESVLIFLGQGQVFGEMALLDQGYRSASVRATAEGCTLYLLEYQAFRELAKTYQHIGFLVMRNLASDLAFKMRHRNLAQM
jgi:CRP/FNR family transcriptional regulator, cyclic AMP receptor protein